MDIMDELANTSVYKKNRFIQIENAFINNNKYTTDEKMLYLSLCTYAFNKNNCYPSHSTLSENLGISRQKIIRVMKSLEIKKGILIIKRKYQSNRTTSNLYILSDIDNITGDFIEESLNDFLQYKNEVVILKGK